MKHPADMTEREQRVYMAGHTHFDTLFRHGYTAEEITVYVQGLRERMAQEEWRALHPGMFQLEDKR